MLQELKNKKIVMLLASDFSFDSRVLKEAKTCQKAGMKVYVLARKSFGTKFYENKNGIKIMRAQTWIDWLWSKISPTKGREVAGSQSAGTNLPRPFIIYTQLINLLFLNRLLVKKARRLKADIIHANDSQTLPAAYKLKKFGFKIVFDAHELYSESQPNPHFIWRKFYIWLEKQLPKVDAVFSVCQSILDELGKRYKTTHLPQAILYNSPFYRKVSYHFIKGPIKLFYIGNKQASRNLDKLFLVVKKLKGVTLTVIGPGWDKEKTDKKIIFLPPVSSEEIVQKTAEYDIGIIPYIPNCLNSYYSTPNKLFEYMMAGLAIAGSDLPEIRRVVLENQNGILFNPRSRQDIHKKLKELIKNKKNIEIFKKNSLKNAQKYSWEIQGKKQLAIYAQVLNKK